MKPGKFRTVALLATASALLGVAGVASAATVVTASVIFLTDLTVTTNSSPNFGYVKAATAATYVLSTAGAVTGGTSEGGSPAAGSYTIAGSASQKINISASGYSANGGTSTPSLATCKYNGVAVAGADCTGAAPTAPAGGLPLLVGLSITTTGGADGTTDHPTFNLNVVYQ
jgi:hypothetical protein